MLLDRGPVLNSGSAARHLKIATGETNDGGRAEAALHRKLATLEDGGLTSQRPSSQSRGSQRVLEEGRGKKKGARCRRSRFPGRLVVCHRDPKQTCWHQPRLFSSTVRPYLLGKSGPSRLKASGLQISRKVG